MTLELGESEAPFSGLRVIFLGTASAKPSRTRNVSSILLERGIHAHSPPNFLVSCLFTFIITRDDEMNQLTLILALTYLHFLRKDVLDV